MLTQTSSPALLYSRWTARPSVAASQHFGFASGSFFDPTQMLPRIPSSNFRAWSAQIHALLGCVLMKRLPPPSRATLRTAFQACSGCFSGSVPISVILPRSEEHTSQLHSPLHLL